MDALKPGGALHALTAYHQFIIYRKSDKIPLNQTTLAACDAHNPANWTDAPAAIRTAAALGPSLGVGFVLTKADLIFCLDFDDCLIETGWSAEATRACELFRGAAVEVSQSGRGLHIFGHARVTNRHRTRGLGVECYTHNRFIGLTGTNAIGDIATDHTETLKTFMAEQFGDAPAATDAADWTSAPVADARPITDDDELIQKALSTVSGAAAFGGRAAFRELWTADPTALGRHFPDGRGRPWDYSQADAALFQHLAFWTGNDCDRMMRLAMKSALVRDKWVDRPDYLQRTVLHAVGLQTTWYTGGTVETVVAQRNLTDMGNGERLAQMYAGHIRYCYPRRKWLVWDGQSWTWDDGGRIGACAKEVVRTIYGEARDVTDETTRKAIAEHARKSEAKARIEAMVGLAQSEKGIPITIDELDADPYLFNCQNGTLDLRTGGIREHRATDLMTKISSCDFLPGARSALWEQFVTDVTGGDGELAGYLQRMVGYALFGRSVEKHLWFLFGPPDTGKSTFITAIMALFGDYARTAAFETWLKRPNMGGNRGDLVALLGARLVTSIECERGARFDTALIRRVSGCSDELTVAAKYESEITYRPTFALLLAANDAPYIRDDDSGTWNRMRRVPFVHTVPPAKKDPQLENKLKAPAVQSAILSWAVDGYQQWVTQGLGTCAAIEASNREYKADMDRFDGFLEELEFEPGGQIAVALLRPKYVRWCEEQGVRPLPPREFNKRLEARGPVRAKLHGAVYWTGVMCPDSIGASGKPN